MLAAPLVWLLFLVGSAADPVAATDQADLFAALDAARRAAAQAPDDATPIAAIAELQIRLGAPAEALAALGRLREVAPDDPRGYVLAALVLRDIERVGEAIALLRQAIEHGLEDAEIAAQLGLLLLSDGDATAADRVAGRALTRAPDDGGLLLVRGLALAADPKRRDEAVAWLDRALAADAPNPGRIHLELGTLHVDATDGCPTALGHFRKAQALLGDTSEVLYRLGSGLTRCGDVDAGRALLARFQARRQEEERRDHGGRSTGTALNEAQRLASTGDVGAALRRLDTLAADQPDDDRVLLLRARLRFASGQQRAALDDVQRALVLRPGRVEAHYLEGLFASQLGESRQAAAALAKALVLDTQHAPSLGLAAALAADSGDLPQAAELFRRAFLHGADSAALRLAYATVLDALDRAEEASEQRRLAGIEE